MNTPTTSPTTVRVREGSDVTVDGVGSIRVLVVREGGEPGYQNVPAGSPVQAVVQSQAGQAVRVNGHIPAPGQALQNGDKVSVSPSNVAGA